MKTFQQLFEELSNSQQAQLFDLKSKKFELQAELKRKGEDVESDDPLHQKIKDVSDKIKKITDSQPKRSTE